MDHLLGRGLLPDPLARGAIDDFPGAFKQSTTAPDPELSCLGEPLVMPLEGVGENLDALTFRRDSREHRMLPLAFALFRPARLSRPACPVAFGRLVRPDRLARPVMCPYMPICIPRPNAQRDLNLLPQPISSRTVRFVHHEDVADLHDTRLERLNPVSRFWHQDQDRAIGRTAYIQL